MPSALDQFRTQQNQINLDPTGPAGLYTGRIGTATALPEHIRPASPQPQVTAPSTKPGSTATSVPPMGGTSPVPVPVPPVGTTTPMPKPVPGTTIPMPKPVPGTAGPGPSVPNPTGPYNPTLANPGAPGTPAAPNQPTAYSGSGGIIADGPPASFSPYNVVTDNLNNLLSSNSAYIRNARQRGREQAASRGMLNSSMSAGAAQRAAIEGAMPIMSQIMGLTSQRESQAFQQQFAQTQATLQDWANDRQFTREFNGQLSLIPIASSADMWASLMNLATQDPTVFTPTVIAGYQDFFQNGFNEYIGRYFQGVDQGPGGE